MADEGGYSTGFFRYFLKFVFFPCRGKKWL